MRWSARRGVVEDVVVIVCNETPTKDDGLSSDAQGHVCLSSYTYNTLIDTYGKDERLEDVFETFEHMVRECIIPNTVMLNTMIHMFGNHGRLEEVASLMQKMEQLQRVPDALLRRTGIGNLFVKNLVMDIDVHDWCTKKIAKDGDGSGDDGGNGGRGKNKDVDNLKKLIDERTFYDKQWQATWQDEKKE
ncbi:pentatricopeptide repeat-containing protein [Tanacetum coccineum]|uniref:Pentatricopeptide repeat-containing protein n=1 Tax=Tanacetum coccineum TaxID=301880 RepID=A0ABQ5AHF7_9ASTR